MAKATVVDARDGNRVPFLRGVLTRSLQELGMEFDAAYALADQVRRELEGTGTVTTRELRERVTKHLERIDSRLARRYRHPIDVSRRPRVIDSDDQETPFSELTYRRCLEASGVDVETATGMARRLLDYLGRRRQRVVRSSTLGRLTYIWLRRSLGPRAAERYLVWVHAIRTGRPIIVLIGGTSGCGKSTVATELANRLEVARTQSTDMLREVMRMMIPERLLPVLHTSSFNAWRVLPVPEASVRGREALVAAGYRAQAELLAVPCEAVVERALSERVSVILEGVHMEPRFHRRIQADAEAVVVPVLLAVLRPKALRRRFEGRGHGAPSRRAERYLKNFDAIWQLQGHLLDEADRLDVAIVNNDVKDQAVLEIMRTVVDALGEGQRLTPRKVFG
jgi:2-phosphoglycerate kinase